MGAELGDYVLVQHIVLWSGDDMPPWSSTASTSNGFEQQPPGAANAESTGRTAWSLESTGQQRSSSKRCWMFVKGLCKYGATCPWSHEKSASDPPPAVCWMFKEGKCKYGETCPWVHEDTRSDQP